MYLQHLILLAALLFSYTPEYPNKVRLPGSDLPFVSLSFFEVQNIHLFTPPVAAVEMQPLPVTIVLAADYDAARDSKARKAKKKALDAVRDALIAGLEKAMVDYKQAPGPQWIILPPDFFDETVPSEIRLNRLTEEYPNHVVALLSQVDVRGVKGETAPRKTATGSEKIQPFYAEVTAGIDLFYQKKHLHYVQRQQSVFVEDRMVLSGLLSSGPAMAGIEPYAVASAGQVAAELMKAFYPASYTHQFTLNLKKNWNDMHAAYQQGKYTEAEQKATELLAKAKGNDVGQLHLLRAVFRYQAGQYDGALQDAEAAARLWPSDRTTACLSFIKRYTTERLVRWKETNSSQ